MIFLRHFGLFLQASKCFSTASQSCHWDSCSVPPARVFHRLGPFWGGTRLLSATWKRLPFSAAMCFQQIKLLNSLTFNAACLLFSILLWFKVECPRVSSLQIYLDPKSSNIWPRNQLLWFYKNPCLLSLLLWLNSIPVLSLLSSPPPAPSQVCSRVPISRRHSLKTSLKHPSDNAAAFSWTEIILDLIVLAWPNHCISCHDRVCLAPNNPHFNISIIASHLLNTTEGGAIAPKALVFLGFAINIRFQLSIRMVDKGKKRV